MKVILLEDDEVKNVKDGYARNYLFPKKLAVPVTEAALKQMEKRKEKMAEEVEKHEAAAKELAEKLSQVTVIIDAEAGEKDKLFGSIGTREIADTLKNQTGIEIDRKKIILRDPIKTLGELVVPIKLFHGLTSELKISVKKK
ncbi:50S ribosomal protein L9 [Candidatus Margulisiibacteriota bacterium]